MIFSHVAAASPSSEGQISKVVNSNLTRHKCLYANRPVAGNVNLCPKDVPLKCSNDDCKGILSTIKHELAHALAFAHDLFGYFRDKVSYWNLLHVKR